MKSRSHRATTLALSLVCAAAAACSSGGAGTPSKPEGTTLKGVHLDVYGVWSGAEQKNFQKVLDAFKAKTGATVTFTSTGDNIATVLGSKIAGGQSPDLALLPQPGLISDYAKKGWIKPLGPDAQQAVQQNYAKIWQTLGSVDGKLYALFFKAANKSTVWYRTSAFTQAGITTPPTTWDDFIKDAKTLSDSGTVPVAVGGADGWTLTDWFENVYLSQAGPDMYDKLTKHEIKWTDPSVKKALSTLAQLWGQSRYLVGGQSGALATDFPASVTATFGDNPKSAMTYEGDFVAGVIKAQTKAQVGTDAKFFLFPAAGSTAPIFGGGDAAVVLKDSKGAQELAAFLGSPQAADIWVKLGGFTSPNKGANTAGYPDDTQRAIAKAVIDAGDNFRFDMSDQAPAAFGGTKGAGEWKDLQDFLKNPANVDAAAAQLESDAAKAYGH